MQGQTRSVLLSSSIAVLGAMHASPASAQEIALGDIAPACTEPYTYDREKTQRCVVDPKKFENKEACLAVKGLAWDAKADKPAGGECRVAEAPAPVCRPSAWNVTFKAGKCVIETVDSKNKDFFGQWAVGIAVVRPRVKGIVEASIVPAPAGAASGATPMVRVSGEVRQESSMLVARHFYPWNPGRRCADGGRFTTKEGDDGTWAPITGFFASCVGAMVAVGLPTSGAVNGQVINFAGFGIAVGSGPATPSDPLAWHFGFGWGRKFNLRVLGDGWSENAPPPAGETQVRYKTLDVGARFAYFTVHW